MTTDDWVTTEDVPELRLFAIGAFEVVGVPVGKCDSEHIVLLPSLQLCCDVFTLTRLVQQHLGGIGYCTALKDSKRN